MSEVIKESDIYSLLEVIIANRPEGPYCSGWDLYIKALEVSEKLLEKELKN